jgi:hypothetical protein
MINLKYSTCRSIVPCDSDEIHNDAIGHSCGTKSAKIIYTKQVKKMACHFEGFDWMIPCLVAARKLQNTKNQISTSIFMSEVSK